MVVCVVVWLCMSVYVTVYECVCVVVCMVVCVAVRVCWSHSCLSCPQLYTPPQLGGRQESVRGPRWLSGLRLGLCPRGSRESSLVYVRSQRCVHAGPTPGVRICMCSRRAVSAEVLTCV